MSVTDLAKIIIAGNAFFTVEWLLKCLILSVLCSEYTFYISYTGHAKRITYFRIETAIA